MYSAGIDIGGSSTKVVLLSSVGEIIEHLQLPGLAGLRPEHAMEQVRRAISEIARIKGLNYPPPLGCGIGVPGVVNHRGGITTVLRRAGLDEPCAWGNRAFGAGMHG
jgi:predicted NBD/HSP70 family sugar kinase